MKKIYLLLFVIFCNLQIVSAQIAVTATTGVSSGTYTTLKASFDAINAGTHKGVITIKITANTTESATAVLNANGNGSASYISVNIKPDNAITPIISGNISSGPVIKLNGSSNVTIDGSNNGTTTRNLTIQNTSLTSSNVLVIGSFQTAPIVNVILKNCTIINGTNTSTAVLVGDASVSGSPGYFNNITIQNNNIQKAYIGLYLYAVVATNNGNNTLVTENNIDSTAANSIRLVGVYAQGLDGFTVTKNSIGNFEAASAEFDRAIWFATATKNSKIADNTIYNLTYSGSSSYAPIGINVSSGITNADINVTNNIVKNITSSGTYTPMGIYSYSAMSSVDLIGNQISNIKNTNPSGYGAAGIVLANTITTSDIRVNNNFVWDVAGYGVNGYTANNNGNGIVIDGGGGYNIDHNTVVLNTNQTFTGAHKSACVLITNNVTASGIINLRNNIFANLQSTGDNLSRLTIANLATSGSNVFSTINYNSYYSTSGNLSSTGTNASISTNITQLQIGLGSNTNSVNINPLLTGINDLHLLTPQQTLLTIPISGITTDIDNELRSTTAPYMGADEYSLIPLPDANNILYVKKGATGNGSSWANALGEVADALKWANDNKANFTNAPLQIWVAGGTYKPMYRPDTFAGPNATDRYNAFLMVNNVKLYGGFAGTETTLSARDLSLTSNASILTGDFNGDDGANFSNNGENAYNIVVSAGSMDQAVLSGFTVTGANRDNALPIVVNGSYLNYGGGFIAAQTVVSIDNCIFKSNVGNLGGGVGGYSTTFTIKNSSFENNKASGGGGFFIINDGYGNATLHSGILTNCRFINNTSVNEGSSIYYDDGNGPGAVLTNCTFFDTTATGAAIVYTHDNSGSAPQFRNTIFLTSPLQPLTGTWSNINSIIFQYCITNKASLGTHASTINNLLSSDPLFVNAAGGDFTLQTGSPAINTGNSVLFSVGQTPDLSAITTDLNGKNRIVNGAVDMGAYEFQLGVTSVKQDVLCYNDATGAITTTIVGGTPPYTYSWSTTPAQVTKDISGLQAGNYILTVTDAASLTATHNVTITQPAAALTGSPTQVNLHCNGDTNGTATFTVSGGTTPYTYVWNNGISSTTNEATNLTAGTYEVTVTDANGCIIKQIFTITEPSALNSVPSQVNVLCHGESTGSATAAISGGVAPYSYVWNNGITSTTNEATNLSAGTYEVTATDANGCIIKQSFTITEPSALNSAPSQVNVLCHGESTGSATTVISGGVAPYSYVWNNGITSTTHEATNLAAGTYEVTVTDGNGCIITESFTITEPTALNSMPSQVDVLCHGESTGSATAVISGGVAPYNYVWNNGITSTTNEATNLAAGTYEVTVTDANGCIIKQGFTITEPSALNSVPSQVNVLCHDNATGSATAVISGGVAPYTYVWNNGIASTTNEATNLAAGTYKVTVTDANDCIIKQSFTITEPSALNSVPSQVNVLCHGESTGSVKTVISGGVAPYTYVWNNGITSTTNEATNLSAGTYEVTVTDVNGCIIKQSFTITEPSALNSVPSQVDVLCNGNSTGSATTVISGGVAPYTYVWNNGITSTTNEATNLSAGTYEVTATDSNGCIIKQSFTITQPTALNSVPSQIDVLCHGESTGSATAVISGGVVPYTYVWNNGITSTTNEATNIAAGTYEITVTDANGCIIKQSFTITEPTALNSVPSQVNVLCHGESTGSVKTVISGGVAPYTYVWNNGITSTTNEATNLSAGTYEVTVTDVNGCIIKQSFTITEPSALNSVPSQVDILCHGESTGSATAVISGGVAPYTYVWNNGITSTTNEATNLSAGTYEVTVTDANGCIIKQSFTITEPTSLNSMPSQVDVLCHSNATGSATAVISGGVSPYSYVWNNGITSTTNEATNLVAGTYEVTATDANGCIIKQSFTITEPTSLNSMPSQVDVLCHSNATGSATAVISGGVSPYSYVWNNGITSTTNEATNLVAGTYEVTATDANGCIIKQSFTITEPSALNSLPSQLDVLCHGELTGSATAVISGGVAPYTYVWNNSIISTTNEATNLSAGTYEVTVTDANGCIIKQSFTITEPTALNSVPTQVNILCHGKSTGSATAVISGGVAPYTYVWNNGVTSTTNEATNLTAGTYEVTVTDANGCIIKQSFTISEASALNSVPLQVNVLCHGNATGSATAVISGGVAPYTYVWNNSIISTTNEATNLSAGTYEVTVTDANGCIIKQSFTITEPTALNSVPTQVNILCHGKSTGSATAVISGGVAPYTYVWNNGVTSTTNEATNLTAGTYEVTVTDANGCIIKQSFTISEASALNSVPSQVNVLCHGESTGSATAVISGGVAPYTYVWNNGIISNTNEATNLAVGTYEVRITDANGCIITESFTITEPPLVLAPFSHNQEFCIGDAKTVNDLVAVGSNLKWYISQYAQIPVQPSTLLTNGMYYGTQTVNGCESKSRIEIKVTVYDTPAPTAIAVQYFCANKTALIGDLLVMGTDILWYNAPTGGSPLNPLASLSNNTMYYASQRFNGCESVTRTAVSVVIHAVNPITSSAVAVCSGTTIGNITIDNYNAGQLKWYDAAIGGNELSSATMVSNGTYYVSTFTNNACISNRQPLQVVVLAHVAVPTVGTQVFCGTAQVKDLPAQTIYGSILRWYSSSAATVPLTANTPLGNGTYYVEHTIGQCSSLRIPVAVRVVSLTAPILNNAVLCHGATIDDIPANQNPSVKYIWFADNTTTVPLNGSDLLATGHYFAAFTQNGCISNRTSVYITVNPKPAKPTGSIVQTFSDYAVVADLKMNEKSVVWFDNYSDALNGINILSQNTVLQDGKDYYAVHVGPNACLSDPVSVKVAIVLGTRGFDLKSLDYYPNPVEHELTIKNADAIKVITVYDILGKQIMQKTFNKSELKIDFSSYSAGTYMVRIETAKGSQFVKIIKK